MANKGGNGDVGVSQVSEIEIGCVQKMVSHPLATEQRELNDADAEMPLTLQVLQARIILEKNKLSFES